MKKTTVYLDPADLRRLKTLAREQDRSTAELIREAVAEYARRYGRARRPRSLGAGHSRHGELSERAEELLRGMGEREAEGG
jgi:predicted transcriptional regulator